MSQAVRKVLGVVNSPSQEPNTNAVEFAVLVRLVADVCRHYKLAVPSFRSPPRVNGRTRTVRREGTNFVVAVSIRGRPNVAVLDDMIDGVMVANALTGRSRERSRRQLWSELSDLVPAAA